MKCYILGAVTGSADNAKEIFETYKEVLKDKITVCGTPLETAKFEGTAEERFIRAEKAIREVDLIIADMSAVSTGAGIEMGMAFILNKKIIVFAKEGSNVSKLVTGMVGKENMIYYKDSIDLARKIQILNLGTVV